VILASWRDEKRCRGGFETRPYEGKDAKGAKERRVMIRFIALFLIAVSLSPVLGADLDQAKKEGAVVLYTTMVVSDFQVFHKALAKKYPFLKINHVRLGASTLVSRAIAEFRAGKHLTDVYGVAPDSLNYMREIDKIPLRRGVDAGSNRVAELIEQTPHVIKVKQFNEIFLGR
jgi:hypothetical protein